MRIKKIPKTILKPLLSICYKVFPESKCIKQYRNMFCRTPNLINPKTFNEKILRKLLFDRDPKLTLFADKFLVRDFVKSRLGGNEHLTKLYAVVDNPGEISNLSLPNRFVMKPNHSSGRIQIVDDFSNSGCVELEKLASKWLQENFYYTFNEWAYKNIKPRIIFEELLESEGKSPDDFRFFCFNGQPRFISMSRKDKFQKWQINYCDLNLSLLPVRNSHYKNIQGEISKPLNLDQMLEIAKILSAGSDFIRVDLYNISGRVLFSELTNYPGAGLIKFDPPSWDLEFGSYWN